jgi:hypothetical protein
MYTQTDYKNIQVLYPETFDLKQFLLLRPTETFSDETIEFLNGLSAEINKDPKLRSFPDVATFAFFCRKANLLNLKEKNKKEKLVRLGRGVVFHIAPSNVPVNFAYSLICGLLSGNSNIVKVPSKDFEQVEIICEALQRVNANKKYKAISDRVVLIRYDKQSTATHLFSSICDIRIIWGGDETIGQIRKNPIPARSFDVTFADRYSICVIQADSYIKEKAPEKIATDFYNDTYLFDQNACTAPHLIIWLGKEKNIEKSKEIFWNKLYELVKSKYLVQPVIAVDKLTSFYSQAAELDDVKKDSMTDNSLWRVNLEKLPANIDQFRCTSGYFSEYNAKSLLDLIPIVNRKYQTLAYYGIEKDKLTSFIKQSRLFGIDRVVPIGKTTDFSLVWDGYELITTLSRNCEIL